MKAKEISILALAALAGLATSELLPNPSHHAAVDSAAFQAQATVTAAAFQATAQPATADTLLVTTAGVWTLTVNAGVPTLTPYAGQVIRVDGGGTPSPAPTDPISSPLSLHKAAVQAATAAATAGDPNAANTKIALAKLWETAANLPVTDAAQLRMATTTIFNALSLPPVWQQWKKAVDQSAASFTALDDARKAWKITAEVLKQP